MSIKQSIIKNIYTNKARLISQKNDNFFDAVVFGGLTIVAILIVILIIVNIK